MTDDDTGCNYYDVFTADTTEDQGRLSFIRRFHQEPERVFRMIPTQTLWVGPVPKPEQ